MLSKVSLLILLKKILSRPRYVRILQWFASGFIIIFMFPEVNGHLI